MSVQKSTNERTHCARCNTELTKKTRMTKKNRMPKYCGICNSIVAHIKVWADSGTVSIKRKMSEHKRQLKMLEEAFQIALAKESKKGS